MAGIQIDGVNNKIDFDDDADTSISASTDDTLVIETAGSERARIDSSGNVMVAVTTANAEGGVTIDADGALNGTSQIRFNRANTTETSFPLSFMNNSGTVGYVSYTNSATTYATSSDYRLKENVVTDWDATTRLKQLKPSRFNFKVNADTTLDGFLAHEVSSIVPEAIIGDKDAVDSNGNPEYQGIDQSKLVPLLVKTVQELESRIKTLEDA